MALIDEGLEQQLAAVAATVERGPLQFTPPGSPAPVILGTGVTRMTPGSVQDLMLIVNDVDVATA